MKDFDISLEQRLETIRQANLYRELTTVSGAQGPTIEMDDRRLLNFSSNDYLGLASHAALKTAAIQAIERYGTGAGASRLICGTLAPHTALETALADFKRTDAALAFSSGYAAAVGTIQALMGKGDIVIIDKLVHACVVDAARLCGASLRVYRHNDLNDLESILRWANQQRGAAATGHKMSALIVTESVFSMDGDWAPLREIVELKDRYGAWLMVDEAHSVGLYGPGRRGLAEALGLMDRLEIQMGTLSKAAGASGGFVCGSRRLIDFLINRARSFIFSTAPSPAVAAAAKAGIALIASEEGANRCAALWQRADQARQGLAKLGITIPEGGAVAPLMMGGEQMALNLASRLRQRGILIPAIRYPTVARGRARLRLTLSAGHTAADVQTLLHVLREEWPVLTDL